MYFPEPTTANWLIGIFVTVATCGLVYRELDPSSSMGYSKFADANKGIQVPSRVGMLVIYGPACILSVSILLYLLSNSHLFTDHLQMMSVLLCIHYLKRVYEVLYVHHYSGSLCLQHAINISCGYVMFAVVAHYYTVTDPRASRLETHLGFILFFIGEIVNHYHHRVLTNLRAPHTKQYQIPYGGLFNYIWCPHYVGEILSFIGTSLVSHSVLVLIMQLGSAAYLCIRARNTRQWYHQRWPDAPKRACLIPGIF
ncbi:3-oxo-5-alpha-steroid 4-dehydrogenase-domain-containing protein [Radiomyces spectabilis]|uniref:3-oxo-5-alpha-steroid 4-dehydrogenase-domain-containing protein n=1 Tax=Radiomyces spectabilis TaxID=64574 RepID=UPI00221FCA0A|nr:3-oxo-5-alpha-steroid 4-dehydrogenase-domain-containing protein [Radiomyces spectabilis]KAI8373048.1 3-oxo-5-alpha-steroid 4-dehydrogenase-domain-containing protein [Radiomyces spectabilis]